MSATSRAPTWAGSHEGTGRGWLPHPWNPDDDQPGDDAEAETSRGVPRRAVLAAFGVLVAVVAGVLARVVFSEAGSVQRDTRTTTIARGPSPAAAGGGLPAAATDLAGSVVPVFPSVATSVVVVDVVGRVRRPGLARLPAGSRVADALAAVGGAVPGAAVSRVNLARKVVDGEQILVPGPHDPGQPVAAAGSGAGVQAAGTSREGDTTGPVDLNTATVSQLDALPGVGPVTAGRIVAWRAQHQRFSRVDELGEVPGIGPKMLDRLRPLVRV